jgi:outer membrane lipoprotein-sorting protein
VNNPSPSFRPRRDGDRRWSRLKKSLFILAACLFATSALAGDQPPDAAKLLADSRAKYAAMTSYSDTGSIVTEYQSPGARAVVEHHTFTTYYQPPRKFLLDFREDPKAGGERYVIWCDGGDFNTWWSTTSVHETYPPGRGAGAFAASASPTHGATWQTAPLLFSKAGLQGPLANFADPKLAGTEELGGRKMFKLTGTVGLAYGTGNLTGELDGTLWIDAETLLIRKIVEEQGQGAFVSRTTTSFNPEADPALSDSVFEFKVP